MVGSKYSSISFRKRINAWYLVSLSLALKCPPSLIPFLVASLLAKVLKIFHIPEALSKSLVYSLSVK